MVTERVQHAIAGVELFRDEWFRDDANRNKQRNWLERIFFFFLDSVEEKEGKRSNGASFVEVFESRRTSDEGNILGRFE
jgi:hypothetical protein